MNALGTDNGLVNAFAPLQMADLQEITRKVEDKKHSRWRSAAYSASDALPNMAALGVELYA